MRHGSHEFQEFGEGPKGGPVFEPLTPEPNDRQIQISTDQNSHQMQYFSCGRRSREMRQPSPIPTAEEAAARAKKVLEMIMREMEEDERERSKYGVP